MSRSQPRSSGPGTSSTPTAWSSAAWPPRWPGVLRGKHQPFFAPHTDTGDHVVVVNADKVVLTADKGGRQVRLPPQRLPGRAQAPQLRRRCSTSSPRSSIRRAVRGMLPKNTLGRQQLAKLKVYAGPDHPHDAQHPQPLEIPGARRPA